MLTDHLPAGKLEKPSGCGIPSCKVLLMSPLVMHSAQIVLSLNECLYSCVIGILFYFGSIKISFLDGEVQKNR